MFVLSRMSDTVRLAPHEFSGDFEVVLEKVLNRKLANKVVLDVGLCICLYDFIEIADSFILPGDGAAYTNVVFRFVVFRPFIDEILVGRILSSNRTEITMSVKFFDDIIVPADKLPNVSKFDESDQLWYWEYPSDEGEAPAKLYMDPGKNVRFRVVEEQFVEMRPSTGDCQKKDQNENTDRKSPYTIIASMSEPGLGCLQWWASQEEDEQGQDPVDNS